MSAETLTRNGHPAMKFLARFLVALVLLLLVGGTIFLATWDIPAPDGEIERIIPNDRFVE